MVSANLLMIAGTTTALLVLVTCRLVSWRRLAETTAGLAIGMTLAKVSAISALGHG